MLRNARLKLTQSAGALPGAVPRLMPFLMAAGLAATVIGQHTLSSDFPRFSTTGPLYMAIGGALFLMGLILRGESVEVEDVQPEVEMGGSVTGSLCWGRRQAVGVGLGVAGGVIGYTQSGGNTMTLWGVVPWIVGCLALIWAFWRPEWRLARDLKSLTSDLRWVWAAVALALIVALAAFLRFYQLGDIPRNMTGDHARDIFYVRDVWEDGFRPLFFLPGREPLKFYIAAPLSSVFGFSFLTLKVGSAIVGVISVFTVYLMARELFDNKRIALLATLLFSLSFLHIIESRGGFRAILGVLAFSIILTFLFRALKFKRTHDFVFAGLALGAGLYTYSALRVVPAAVGLVLLVSLVGILLRNRREAPAFVAKAALLILAALVVFAPLGRFVADFPDEYFARAGELSEPPWESDTPLETLGVNLKDTALMFNWTSEVWPGMALPYLDYVTGALFPLGLAVMLISWALWRRSIYGYAMLVFLVVLIPSYVKRQADPVNALRMDFMIPLVLSFAAIPLYVVAQQIAGVVGKRWPFIVLPALAAAVVLIGFVNYQLYFDDWVERHRGTVGNRSEVAAVIHDFVDSGGSLDNAYLKQWPYWMDEKALQIEIGDLDWQGTLVEIDEARAHAVNPEAKLYVFYNQDEEAPLRLKDIYPEGTLQRIQAEINSPGSDFFIFRVPSKVAGSD